MTIMELAMKKAVKKKESKMSHESKEGYGHEKKESKKKEAGEDKATNHSLKDYMKKRK